MARKNVRDGNFYAGKKDFRIYGVWIRSFRVLLKVIFL
jgi:hypothetical protein